MSRIKFDEPTKAEQRVVIAKDLIARLNAQKFIAKSATYLDAEVPRSTKGVDDAKAVLTTAPCIGCEIGGLFLCAVDRFNALKLEDAGDVVRGSFAGNCYQMETYLSRWFPKRTLDAVERAFEGWDRYEGWANKRTPDQRMRAISRNIIRNKGRFIGSQLLEAK